VLLALLFLPALLAIAFVARRRKPQQDGLDPLAALDALLLELERTTVEIESDDELRSTCARSRRSPSG